MAKARRNPDSAADLRPNEPQNQAEPDVPAGGTTPAGDNNPAAGSYQERVAQRAYELYESRGGDHGRALDDWLSAEQELAAHNEGARGSRSER